MVDEVEDQSPSNLELTSLVVANFVANNNVATADLPGLIKSVHAALCGLGMPSAPAVVPKERPKPAVPVHKSITPDFLICLEDGRKLKSMKRHLSALGMTPDEYRQRWGLPAAYPMVAPNYAAARSVLAMKMGLGGKRRAAIPASAKPAAPTPQRGRPKSKIVKPNDDTSA